MYTFLQMVSFIHNNYIACCIVLNAFNLSFPAGVDLLWPTDVENTVLLIVGENFMFKLRL